MRLKAVLDFPRKVLRSVSRHGVAGTLRHGVRAFILQGGAARAEEVAELRAALSATRAEADAMREAIGGLDVRAAAIQAALDGREVPAPFDPAPLYRTQALHQEALEWLLEDAGAGGRPPAPRHGPLVSVILPVWNRAALVGEAIRSVQAQHYATWELLV